METLPIEELEQYGEVIDRLVTTPVCRARGNLFQPMKTIRMYEAARTRVQRPLCLRAAEMICSTVKSQDNVLILTGSYHPIRLPVGETDGPPGGVTLARALDIGLGAKPFFAVENPLIDLMQEACKAAGLLPMPPEQALKRDRASAIVAFPTTDHVASRKAAEEFLDTYNFSCVVTSERLGRNRTGRYHSAGGTEHESKHRCKVDHIIDVARERGVLTVAVGDGGNEIGFGGIFDETRKIVNYGEMCRCLCGDGIVSVVDTDALIVAANSNWGVYGLEAAMALITGNQDMMHGKDIESRVLHRLADMGCVDGVTMKTTPTCDGTPEEASLNIVDLLKMTVAQAFRVEDRQF